MRKELSAYVLPFSSDSSFKEMFTVPGKCLFQISTLRTLTKLLLGVQCSWSKFIMQQTFIQTEAISVITMCTKISSLLSSVGDADCVFEGPCLLIA